jgi:hypothetical protein
MERVRERETEFRRTLITFRGISFIELRINFWRTIVFPYLHASSLQNNFVTNEEPELLYFSIILRVWNFFILFRHHNRKYGYTTHSSFIATYFSSLSHHQVFDLFTFICNRLLLFPTLVSVCRFFSFVAICHAGMPVLIVKVFKHFIFIRNSPITLFLFNADTRHGAEANNRIANFVNFILKLALTLPTSGGRSVGIVRLRTTGHRV